MSSQLCALHCVSSSLSVFFEVNGGIHSDLVVRGVGTIVRLLHHLGERMETSPAAFSQSGGYC